MGEALAGLTSLAERKAYVKLLVDKGWTYQSIAKELKLTREAVRIYLKKPISDEHIKMISHLPIPELPTKEVYGLKRDRVLVEPDVLIRLKELHKSASQVRGKGKKNRNEAEQFTKLAWQQIERGVTSYSLAKALGITASALYFRFVRYGYKPTNGTSKVFRKLTHRAKEGDN